MQRRKMSLLLVVGPILILFCLSLAAQDEASGSRKIVSKLTPAYPSLARTMRITGVVRVEAIVSPNGSVKNIEIHGGNPVLIEAASDAVIKWRWEPSSHETREPIEIKFDPQQ